MKRLYNALILVGTLVAMVATVYSVFLQLRAKRLELTVQMTACDELTPTQDVPELDATFFYQGQKIQRLWKVSLIITNTGDKTIIGQGAQKNIMADELCFSFSGGCRVLNQDVEKGDFPGRVYHRDNQLCVSFPQWRKGEIAAVSCFVAGNSDATPPRINAGRDLIDGDIVVKGLPPAVPPPRPLVEHLPNAVGMPAKVVGALSSAIWGGLLIVFGFFALRDLARTRRWKRSNFAQLQSFLANAGVPEPLRTKYLESPNTMTNALWAQYPGDKLAVMFDGPNFSTAGAAIVPFFLLTFLGVVTLVVAASVFLRY